MKVSQTSSIVCFHCGKVGHRLSDCLHRKENKQKRSTFKNQDPTEVVKRQPRLNSPIVENDTNTLGDDTSSTDVCTIMTPSVDKNCELETNSRQERR